MHESPLNLGHKNSDDSFHYMHISITEILPNGVVLLHLDIKHVPRRSPSQLFTVITINL